MTYYQKVLYPFARQLVLENKKDTSEGYQIDIDDVNESDLQCLASYFFEYDGRDLISVYENKKYDQISSSLIKLLQNDNKETKLDFSENIVSCITEYYKPIINTLLQEICVDAYHDDMWESGLTKRYHQDNNESYWVRL